jgi:hypothetical protein
VQVPGLDEDLPEAPPKDDSADLLPAEPENADPAEESGAGGAAEAGCAVPNKALRQMVMALVPAASGVAAGLECAWTSRGTLAADRASVWALNLSRQVMRRLACCFAPPLAALLARLKCLGLERCHAIGPGVVGGCGGVE